MDEQFAQPLMTKAEADRELRLRQIEEFHEGKNHQPNRNGPEKSPSNPSVKVDVEVDEPRKQQKDNVTFSRVNPDGSVYEELKMGAGYVVARTRPRER